MGDILSLQQVFEDVWLSINKVEIMYRNCPVTIMLRRIFVSWSHLLVETKNVKNKLISDQNIANDTRDSTKFEANH